ncbi:MATE family efflux transporter [Bordetella hinzii]|uniref:MATE family efflux transporter n=1 Tax=Bordetella hinzii TaxID=103855 RepID=UPI0005196F58|nr:MATE family efflux transporter [Bordetella hinzii]QWF39699.1 MATE family efflux transporter [Bordetella hinzii]QWF44247.1 MATE family efflux transporter [Bordetella hinzii]QWF48783.1 MATE family efflux transporter [Bordetella hinzii]QWF53319.1 MATE family efflux transporter [Bordetella hinzii]QWF57808.1 MATE family efflux transporter [Bordetella hinzii]
MTLPVQAGLGATMRGIARQAWPVLVSQWAGIAFGVLDTAMTGHASARDLAAMSLSASVFITVFVGLMGVIHALIPIAAQHYGAERPQEVGHVWGQGVWLALGLSVVGGLLMCFPDMWLAFSGDVDPEVRNRVAWYLRALVLALPSALVFRTIYALGTAVSRPKVVMAINLTAIAFKALFNWILIYGKVGLPALGATGAGLSTALVSWLSLAAGWWIIRHDRYFQQFQLRIGRPDPKVLKELLRLGLPMGGSYLVEVSAFTFMALLVAREGTLVSGGHQIMSNLAALCYMMPMALGVASAAMAAQAIGAGHHALARRVGTAGLALGLIGALLTSAILLVGRPAIIAAYTDDAGVAAVAGTLLAMIPLFHLCDSMQCINSYLLRAYKVAVVPLILQTVALAGVGLVGGWWLGFGPGRGGLDGLRELILPGSPTGAGTMWLMAMLGLGLSATLLHLWYRRILRRYA